MQTHRPAHQFDGLTFDGNSPLVDDGDLQTIDWNAVAIDNQNNPPLSDSDLGARATLGLSPPDGSLDQFPASNAAELLLLDTPSRDGGDGPDAASAKKSGGGTTSGSGGTSGGSGTSGGGGTSGGTSVGQGATTTTLHSIPIAWHALNPPTGEATLPTDPYFANWEWNITNATTGIDVEKAWQNYTGLGVKVGIVDDGIDYNHPDLNPNYLFNLQYDAVTADGSAYGNPSTDPHGTTVAGILAAADNGVGMVGVAYNAGIAGFRIGYGSTGTASQVADALAHLGSNGMDVGNASWGYSTPYQDNFYGSWSSSKTAILNDVTNGRGGLGVDIVFAAGNGRASGDNVNYHNYQNDPYVITVAATDVNGHYTSFSDPGAALLVSAPGLGLNTDDRLGSAGYSAGDYTSAAGTSYAAPEVAGIIALMLQANPQLGFLDVQEILAYSAKQTDPTDATWQTNGANNWNGGGLHFSNDYGFGLVDATAAVKLAESWQKQSTFADMSTESATHTDNAAIPDGSGSLQSTINFGSSLTLDKVVVDLNITHPHVSDLTVTLTSPDGTTAVLASHPANGTGSGIVFETSANTFMGEDAKGNWTLTVADSVAGNVGTLNNWTLTAIGDAPGTPTTYIYTDEFATASGAGRAVLNDASGNATINTAAVTSGSYLDLNPGAIDTIAGKSLQIGASTVIKNVWSGDGNDTIIANDFGDTIQAGQGNNTIVAGHGADTLYGAPAGSTDTFDFNFLKNAPDTIQNWASGNDVVNMAQLLTSIGYTGADPLADGWVSLISDTKGGTDIVVNPHNGQAAQTIVDVLGVAPSALHEGTDILTVKVA